MDYGIGDTLFAEARKLVNGDRREDYGDPMDSFLAIASMWRGYLSLRPDGARIMPRDVCNMMMLLKIARDAHNPKKDNTVDICGYAALADYLTPKVATEVELCGPVQPKADPLSMRVSEMQRQSMAEEDRDEQEG